MDYVISKYTVGLWYYLPIVLDYRSAVHGGQFGILMFPGVPTGAGSLAEREDFRDWSVLAFDKAAGLGWDGI